MLGAMRSDGRRHHKGQQVKDSLAALNCEQTRTHQHHSGGTPSTPHQQQVSSPSFSLQPSTDKVLSVGERKPPTNDEIHAIISEKLAYFCNYLIQKKRSDGHSNELGRDSILKSVQSCLATTSASKEDTMIEECSAAVGQSNYLAHEEDNSKGVTLIPRFKETGDCATAASEKHSTEYPHIMLKVAATCTKNEEESPVVLAAVPGMTWDDAMREKKPTLMLNRSSSQEEYKSPSLNGNKNVDDIDQVPGASWAFNPMTERKKGATALKPVGTVGLDSVQGMVDVAEDPQTKSSPVVSGNGTFGSLINRKAKQKKSIEDQQHASEDLGSAPSQTNLRISVPENKFQKHAQRCESKVEEARQLFKDSSDNDVLQLATELPTKEPWECSSPACFEVLQYDDISDAESQIESVPVETTIPTRVAAPNDRQSPFENTGDGHVQGQAKVMTETLIAQHCSLCFVEIDDCSESKCCCGRQTKPSVSYSPSSVLSDLLSDDDTTNDEMDDDHLVIPIGIFDLRYEPEEEDQDSPETNLPSPKRCPSPNHVRSSAFPPVLVFDTWEHLLKAEQWKSIIDVSFEHEMDSEGDVETLQKRGSSDSCGTDDSFDYPSAIKHNYMTVSKKMFRKGLAPVPSKTDDSLPSLSSSDNEVTNMQDQTWGMDKPIEAKAVSKCLQGEYIIIMDSDTEDESTQKCKKQTKWKRLRSSDSGDSVDSQYSQQKRHSPDTFKEKISLEKSVILINDEDDPAQNYEMPRFPPSGLHKGDAQCVPLESVEGECGPAEETRPSSADSPQHQSKRHEPQFREVTEDACSVLHSEQLVEARSGSDHVPHKAKRQKMPRRVVIPDSETVLKKGHFSKRKSVMKETFSSGSEDNGGDDLIASKSRLIESVICLCKTANTKSLSESEDLPEKQPQSVMKDADSHLPNTHMIPRYIVECSGSKGGIQLLKEPVVHKRGKDGPWSPEASTTASKKIESCDKNKAPIYRNKKVRFFINDKNQATNNVQDGARKPPRVSRQLSLPVQEGPSTSFSSLSSTSRPLPVARQRSRSWKPSEASCLPYNPRELSFPPNRLRSCSSSSTLKHPPSKGPASTMPVENSIGNSREKVNSYRSIRRDIRLREDNVRPQRHCHDRARDDQAPRKRHNPPKPVTTLMKRATNDAKQWTKARNQVSSKERRDSVGEGYKWSEKSTKGSSWEEEKKDRSPPRYYL
ncbi:uncharacterized protein LOC117725920 isoform X2 [Cyclopterus lumpus]|uniref:uncharacterized protein LOC117725920 isoform X2 n=1 Tax=Cyclopterus lumpus TaxID=8103 RepID=UPI001486ADDC|nr:uncharacterized protein LOC117725920 isoform X2 [Cyclopterus lumpus]